MGPSPARTHHRPGVLPALPLVPAARTTGPRPVAKALQLFRPGRPARGHGLVHGEKRPGGRSAGQPVPPDGPPGIGFPDLRPDAVDGPRPVAGPRPAAEFARRPSSLRRHAGRAGVLHGADRRPAPPAGLRRFAAALAGLVFFMVLTGGLVAGIHAGLAYNSFPLMNGDFMPEQMWLIEPWWLNLFSNIGTVQFDHRLVAWALIFLIPILWWRGRGANLPPRARLALDVD